MWPAELGLPGLSVKPECSARLALSGPVDALPGRCGVGVLDSAVGSTEMSAFFVVGAVVMEVAVAPGVALEGVA